MLVHAAQSPLDAGTPDNPNGMRQNWCSPIPGPGQNAVSSATGTCQYPLCKSRMENVVESVRQSWTLSGSSRG